MAETQTGFGRVLVAIYAVFAISATARSAYQLLSKFEVAPMAYGLSALSGVVYIVATWALATDRRQLAWIAVGFEAAGVLVVGLLTVLNPDLLGDETVWSRFGAGYGYVPLLLPIIGLAWLVKTGRARAASSVNTPEAI
ncbi:MAG: hypothetical protein E6Q27_04130 [Aeromicrobium sp.]|nr:MAG: hypothetical protein E6Q27_04130 [Aeromicrobium sp.]